MIQTIYAEVPREKIEHLTRAEFINGQEQSFYDGLKASMSKHGFRDPVYCHYGSNAYGDKIKVIVGNNRMVVAKEFQLFPLLLQIIKLISFLWKDEFLRRMMRSELYFICPSRFT